MQRTTRAVTALVAMVAMVAATIVAPANTEPVAAASSDAVDLIFAVDGSGSIDAGDWDIQLQGIEAALADRSTVPVDGSVAVGVVQWSSSARVEVELTVIDSEETADQIAAEVLAITQMGSSTGPGYGINKSVDEFAERQRDGADQVICMSTDGTQNTGPDRTTAASDAQDAGVETYSVLAIEDGSFTGATARSHYGPIVFGGGTVTVTRNSTEFAGVVANGCFPSATELVGIEVNQVIQNWNNDIPVFAGKDTVVRAFVQSLDGDPVRVTGRLHGTRDGSELPGSPLSAGNTGGAIFATADNAERRDERDASLNFELPASWVSGDVELFFEIPGGVACAESAAPANTCRVDVTFAPALDMELRVVDIPWDDGSGSGDLNAAQLAEQARRVEDGMPVSDLDYETRTLRNALDVEPDLGDVLRTLTRARAADGCGSGCDEYYYGAVEGSGGGLGYRPGVVSAGYLSGVDGADETGYARNRVTHEVGHNLGITHAVDRNRDADADLEGPCGSSADASTTPFPYINTVPGFGERPTLSDLGDANSEVWGVAPRYFSGSEELFISSPHDTFELMGYCSAAGQWRWPSRDTYDRMISGLGGTTTSTSPAGDQLLVTGVVAGDQVQLDPVVTIDVDDVPAADPGGTHTLKVVDENGVERTATFTPIQPHGDAQGAGGEEPQADPHFLVTLDAPDAPISSLTVEDGSDTQIAQFTASDNAPTVTITSPSGGDTLDQDTATFTWDGNDDDGDALSYLVQYRPAEDAAWQTLATDLTEEQLTVDRSELEGSDQARIRVVASDGMLIGEAVSDSFFTVANNDPTVAISSPADGQQFSGVQQIILEADARDPEDGTLDGAGVTWTSNHDGSLGSGAEVVLSADELSVESDGSTRMHTITVTATDARGQQVTDQITIQVARVATPIEPPPSDGGGDTSPPPDPGQDDPDDERDDGGEPTPDLERLAGSDRVQTSVAASRDQWADHGSTEEDRDQAQTAVLARADEFADALVGTPLAVAGGGPLLLSDAADLSEATGDELERILPPGTDIIVLGGIEALSNDVFIELADRGFTARRIAGSDRFATAVAVADELGDPATILLSTGAGFADAVTAGAAAAHVSGAVLLTDGDVLPDATADYLDGHDPTVVAVGGPATRARPEAEGVAGEDRYATSTAVAERFFHAPTALGLASGEAFPDSLSGGAVVGRLGGPILLTPSDGLPGVVATYLQTVADGLSRFVVIGGSGAISDDVESQVADILAG